MALDDNGYDVDGPHADIEAITSHIQDRSFDIATLDVNIMGNSIYPVAKELAKKRIPIVYVTGSDLEDPMFSNLPKGAYLQKPFHQTDLLNLLEKKLG